MESQLKKNLEYTWRHRIRASYQRLRLGQLGKSVYIDKRVEFMRFPSNIYIGHEVVVKEGARICSCNQCAIVKIGDRTTFGFHSFLFASEKISIGNDCLIAPFVYIVDSNHRIELGKNINQQGNETSPIIIGNDVWIASSVTILKGVKIGDGAVVAANSVVNNVIRKNEIWGGSPAKKIGERN